MFLGTRAENPMKRLGLAVCCVVLVLSTCCPVCLAQEDSTAEQAIQRGVTLLAAEVPAWAADHNCYSCHNNSNAAQALAQAKAVGFEVPAAALVDTNDWLLHPERWKDNGGDPAFADETLANIQFAAALATVLEQAAPRDADTQQTDTTAQQEQRVAALRQAARLIVADQQPAGFWRIGGRNQIGTPATLGNTLATREALRTLRLADSTQFAAQISKAEAWLLTERPETVFDAAALLLAMADLRAVVQAAQPETDDEKAALVQRLADLQVAAEHARGVLHKGQAAEGGFGPYIIAPPEPFDTAIAVLALGRWGDEDDRSRLTKARDALLHAQYQEGDWPETTRPAGNESYAQRMSTTGWAVLALLEARRVLDNSDE